MIYSTTVVHYLRRFYLYNEVFSRIDKFVLELESIGNTRGDYHYNINNDWENMSLPIKHMLSSCGIRSSDWLEENPGSILNNVYNNSTGHMYYTAIYAQ